jgi:hypothetical protein
VPAAQDSTFREVAGGKRFKHSHRRFRRLETNGMGERADVLSEKDPALVSFNGLFIFLLAIDKRTY